MEHKGRKCASPLCERILIGQSTYCSNACRTAAYRSRQGITPKIRLALVEEGDEDDQPGEVVKPEKRSPWAEAKAVKAGKKAKAAEDVTKLAGELDSVRDLLKGTRSQLMEQWVAEGWPTKMAQDPTRWTVAAVARATSQSQAQISRWYQSWEDEIAHMVEVVDWKPSAEAAAELWDFPRFRAHNFHVPDVRGHVLQGVSYLTPPFQAEWGKAIDHVIAHSGILMILAPPRHGKSEFLSHKLIQLILRNPNIRAMWVGGNEDIANQSVEQVRDELANNTMLRSRYLPPDTSFQPKGHRAGYDWKTGKFTVSTRNVTGIKSPTLRAVGKGGKILSRDADVIVVDDIVDHASTMTEGRREDDLRWFRTQLMSRREPHTAVIIIGSRQHYSDIYKHLLSDETGSVISLVDSAHVETACQGEAGHPEPAPGVTSPCLLFPELRSYEWLSFQEKALGRELYEMVYLNKPRSEGASVFDERSVLDSRNPQRSLGRPSQALLKPPGMVLPPGTAASELPDLHIRMVAGLDPATKGYQASFLWAAQPATERLYMVDLDNTKGAGIPGALDIMRQWLARYELRHWIIEENAAQAAYLQDREIREWAAANGVTIRGHHTGYNRSDQNLGVTGLAQMFRRGLVDLPYGDEDTRAKVDAYVGQLLSFEAGPIKRQLSDIVMASWFPLATMRRWRSEHLVQAASVRDQEFPWEIDSLVGVVDSMLQR